MRRRSGKRVRAFMWNRVVEFMTSREHEGLPQQVIAKRLGMSLPMLRDYLSDELWAEVARRRSGVVNVEELTLVDRAMLERAKEGSVAAAKLIYARLGGVPVEDEVPSLEELEVELGKLKGK
ncbi:MAG: hypothetical protein EBQ80_01315 [Proteobacteria bacterium]|nr:hypothetical protein [Pseudomonadota bacterium]